MCLLSIWHHRNTFIPYLCALTKLFLKKMKTTLLISTYNWETALSLCLESILIQSVTLDEVIIADDGSTEKTAELINSFRKKFSCPLIHVWHEDNGFRVGQIRNKAIAASSSDYIIQIDGDIIIHPRFVEDHINVAKKGYFSAGSRFKITPKLTKRLLSGESNRKASIRKVSHYFNLFRIPLLTPLLYNIKQHDILYGRGCNLAFWKDDALAVNGYDEDFVGYGREDTDFIYRLLNNGIKKRVIKFKAIQFHMYHVEKANITDGIMNEKLKEKSKWCKNGLDKY